MKKKLPKNLRKIAMRSVLSSKVKDGNLVVIEDLTLKSNKTSNLRDKLSKLPIGKSALFVDGEKINKNFYMALKNIPNFDVLPSIGANVYDIMKKETLILSKDSLEILVNSLATKDNKSKAHIHF